MITNEKIRERAIQVALDLPNSLNSKKLIQQILQENEVGLMFWAELPSQPGLRAFEGTSHGIKMMVMQANIAGHGLQSRGTAIVKEDMHVLVLPTEVADCLFHLVAAANPSGEALHNRLPVGMG